MQFESSRFEPEYYDLTTDPDERLNLYPTLDLDVKARLAAQLEAMHGCSGAVSCQKADRGA